jgi:RNA polymerase sigma-70 factor (ECF subfamily)
MAGITPLALSRRRPSAFADFYAQHAERLLVFFARRTFDVHAAADLTAETFAQAYGSRGRFRGTTDDEAAGWLYAIAHRQLARYRRRGLVERQAVERLGLQLPALGDDEYARIEAKAGLAVLRPRLADAAGELAPTLRVALWLRVVDELPYSEVARRLAISEEAARARVSRALRSLAAVVPADLTSTQEAAS